MHKKLFVVFVTILLFLLHLLPAIMLDRHPDQSAWGVFYLPLFVLTILWGVLVRKHFHYLFD